jgi:response regulator RpfG family c-di-GMP phosphodiesterase
MMAVADVYDALVSRRYYKAPMSHADAKTQILHERGSHFDPELVDAFVECSETFHEIAARYTDNA